MAAFKWGCSLSYLFLMMMAAILQVNAQFRPSDLIPRVTNERERGVIVFEFKSLEGIRLQCNFKDGPRNVDCTNGYELYTEALRPGRHVMDIVGRREGTSVGKITHFFVVEKGLTLNLEANVQVEGITAKVCFSTARPASFMCKLGDGEWVNNCTSCKTYTELCPGLQKVHVRAVSKTNIEINVTTDKSFEIGPGGNLNPSFSSSVDHDSRSIKTCFNATREARFECRINRGTWKSCTSCHSHPNLCPGYYHAEVRVTSVHCPEITSNLGEHHKVGPSLEISRAGMDIDCNRGEYALESNIPSMWRCRVNSDSWHSCKNGTVLSRLPLGTHTVTVEAQSACNQSEKVQTRFDIQVPHGVRIKDTQVKSAEVKDSLVATFTTCSLTETYCRIDSGPYVACSSPYSIPSHVRPGPHRIHIKAELNNIVFARHQMSFFKEMVLRINGSTEVTGHSVGACFQSNYPARFECRVDSNSWESCTSCAEKNELCPGRHQFAVRGTARSNSSVTASTSFPFSTTDRNIAVDVTSEVTGSSAEVCFTASRKSTFECSIDRRAWQSCTSCVNYDDICAGQHTVMVRAASRICSSVSGRSETRFNIQSDLEITTARMEVNCNNGVYSLATNRPSRLRCRMNTGAWRTCSNGQRVNNMAAGVYNVEVEAALQCNPAIKATKTFNISVPDNVKVGAVQVSKYERGRLVVTFDECKAAEYFCVLDGGELTKCTSPFPITAVLSPGRHTVKVMARTPPGYIATENRTELGSTTVVIDIPLEVRCSVVVQGPRAVVCFSASHNANFGCKLDSGRWSDCTSCTHYYDLCPGRHTATVNATAIRGFSYKNITTCSFTVTTNELEIDSSAVVDGEDASICFESTRSVNYECQLDGGSWRQCSSCANYTGLCPGQHSVSVRGTSDFCPTVKGSVVQRFQTTTNFKFTKIGMRVECATGTYDLETSHPSTLRCRIGTSTWSSCSDGSMVSGLRLGSTQISVEASLRCDPSVKIRETFTVAVPDNVVIPGIETSYNSDGYLVATFDTCPLATYWCTVDGGRRVRCTSPHTWKQQFQPGLHTLRIVATAGARNIGQASTKFNTVFTSNSSVSVSGPNATVCFAASHNARFECRLNEGQWVQCTSCFTSTELCRGRHSVDVRATDISDESVQNISRSTFEITDNSIVISAKPEAIQRDQVRVCFSLSRQGDLQCRLDNNPWKDCSSCETFSNLCAGNHSVSARAVSPVCDGVEGSGVVNFKIQSNLEITKAELEVECTTAVYKLTTNNPSTLRCRIDNKVWNNCASGVVVTGLSRGTHRVEVEATLDCNPLIKATKVFSVTTPGNIDVPEVVVRRGDGGILFASFEVCETAQYECQVDNGTRGKCTSPLRILEKSLPPGGHTVTVFAVLGDSTRISASFTFTVGLQLNITAIPTRSEVSLCHSVSHKAVVECKVDDGDWTECSECSTFSELCPGPHRASVRALANGITTEKIQNFEITAYDVSLQLNTHVNEDLFTACFSSSVVADLKCRLTMAGSRGNGEWLPCSNCSSYSNLCAGEYNFNIEAASAKCPEVEGGRNYSFTVGSNLEFSKAGMEVECSTGKYTIMTTEPAVLRCRIDSGNWQTCANNDVIEGLAAGRHMVEVEASLSCNPSTKVTTSFTAQVPNGVEVGKVTVSKDEDKNIATFDMCSVAEYYCRVDDNEETKCSSPYSIPKSTPPGDHTLTVTAKALGSVLSSSETTFHVEDKQIITATVDVKKCGALLNIQLNQSDIICLCYLDNKENGENCSDGQAYQGLTRGRHQVRIVGWLAGESVYETTVTWENTAVCVESVVYAAVTIKENSAKLNIFIGTPQTTYMCQLDGGMWQKCSHGTVFNDLTEGPHVILLETRSFLYKKTQKRIGPFTIYVPLFRVSGSATSSGNKVTLHLRASQPATFQCRMDQNQWVPCHDGFVFINPTPGVHRFQARATAKSNGRTVTLDLGTVQVGKVISQGQCKLYSNIVSSQGQVTVQVKSSPVGSIYCRMDNSKWTPCYHGKTFYGVAVGDHIMEVKLIDTVCSTLPPLRLAFSMV